MAGESRIRANKFGWFPGDRQKKVGGCGSIIILCSFFRLLVPLYAFLANVVGGNEIILLIMRQILCPPGSDLRKKYN